MKVGFYTAKSCPLKFYKKINPSFCSNSLNFDDTKDEFFRTLPNEPQKFHARRQIEKIMRDYHLNYDLWATLSYPEYITQDELNRLIKLIEAGLYNYEIRALFDKDEKTVDKLLSSGLESYKIANIAGSLPNSKHDAAIFLHKSGFAIDTYELLNSISEDKLDMVNSAVNAKKSGINSSEIVALVKAIIDNNLSIEDKTEAILCWNSLSDEKKDILKASFDFDFDKKINQIEKSLSCVIDVIDSDRASIKEFSDLINQNDSDFNYAIKNIDYDKFAKTGVPLKYSRKNFICDLSQILKNCDTKKKEEIFNLLKITPNILEGEILGYDGILTDKNLNPNDKIHLEVKKIVQKFIFENEITTGDKKVDKVLNSLIEAYPEFINIIGKKQHSSQNYTLDLHIFKTLKGILEDEDYQNLANRDKIVLKYMALFHDIAKKEFIKDDFHPEMSSYYARDLLSKTDLSEKIKERIVELIDNHHGFQSYNEGNMTDKELSVCYRRTNDIEVAKIFTQADIKAVSVEFYNQNIKSINSTYLAIKKAYFEMNKNGQILNVSKIKNKNLIPTINYKGKDIKVLDFTKLDKDCDLSQYGFNNGVTPDKLRLLVHMSGSFINAYILDKLDNVSNKVLLSTSYCSLKKAPLYNDDKIALSLDFENSNLATALNQNQSSDCRKDFKRFKSIMSNQDEVSKYRSFMPDIIKKELGINDEEYSKIYRAISVLDDLELMKNKTIKLKNKIISADDILSAIKKASDTLLDCDETTNNEVVVYAPKINAVVVFDSSIDDVDDIWIDYAHKKNLPILILGNIGD